MNAMLRLLVSLILIVASMPACSAAPSSSTAAQSQIAAKLTSVIHFKPGAVYEIKSVPMNGAERDAATVVSRPPASLSNLTSITAENTPVFETNKTTSTAYLVDKQSLLSHPLLTERPVSSLPLINDTLGALGLPNLIGQIVPQTLKQVLGDVFEIAQLPTRLNYRIGPNAGGQSQLLPGVTALPGVSSITSATGTLSSLTAVTGTTANLGTVTSTATSTLGTVSTTVTSTLNSVTGLVGGTVGRVVTPLTGGGGTGGGGGLLPNLGGGLCGALGGLLGH